MERILIMGLPGAGKTTLARILGRRLGAVHYDANEVRANINEDLGFSPDDRIEQARRMGGCATASRQPAASRSRTSCVRFRRRALPSAPLSRSGLTGSSAAGFKTPIAFFAPRSATTCGSRLRGRRNIGRKGSPRCWCGPSIRGSPRLCSLGATSRSTKVTASSFWKVSAALDQVCIGVRDTGGASEKDPFGFEYAKARIDSSLNDYAARFTIVSLPNVSAIFYGRDVGYAVERIDLDEAVTSISATDVRKLMGV